MILAFVGIFMAPFAVATAACGEVEVPYNGVDDDCDVSTLDDDLDRDGWLVAEDCDDLDPRFGAEERPGDGLDNDCDPATPDSDLDGDGVDTPTDCDDLDPAVPAGDADCDGVPVGLDCDDADPNTGSRVVDQDCDLVLDVDDCDADDVALGDVRLDADCDGVQRWLDCDDEDALLGAQPLDEDCDGLANLLDCAPNDRLRTGVDDSDCDGVAVDDDCDDTDASRGAQDADCDGTMAPADCDDGDPQLGAMADDGDCDGVSAEGDCDDSDPMSPSLLDDLDCDGVPNAVDCDDTTVLVGADPDDRDCDGVPWSDDCDDTDPQSTVVAEDADCDGVVASLDCNDQDRFALDWAIDVDCDTFVASGDCVEGDPLHHVGARMQMYEDANCNGEIDLSLLGAHVTWAGDGYLGSSGAVVGDLDDDGSPELAFGITGTGVYILSPAGTPDWTDEEVPDAAMVIISAQDGEDLGRSLSVGDVDGDGLGDLLVGDVEAAYLFLGWQLALGGTLDVEEAFATFVVDSWNPQIVGDVDGDGLADLVFDDPEEAFLVWGSDLDSRVPFVPRVAGDGASTSVGGVGDVDGDGLVDLAAGAAGTGHVYIVSGGQVDGAVDLASADWVIEAQRGDEWGRYDFTPLGDIDLDGIDDLAVCEHHAYDGLSRLSVVSGVQLLQGQLDTLSDAVTEITGGDKDVRTMPVASLDVDNDGLLDLLVGDAYGGPGVLLFDDYYGLELDDHDNSVSFHNPHYGPSWVDSPGDVDGDGVDDLYVGGAYSDAHDQGVAYLIYFQFP